MYTEQRSPPDGGVPVPPETLVRALYALHASTNREHTCRALLDLAMALTTATGARITLQSDDVSAVDILDCATGTVISLAMADDDAGSFATHSPAAPASPHQRQVLLHEHHRVVGELTIGRTGGEPLTDSDDAVLQVLAALARQQLERTRQTTELTAERSYFKHLVEQIPAAVFLTSADDAGTGLYYSPQVADIIGYDVTEVMRDDMWWDMIVHPDDRERVVAAHRAANRTGETWDMEYRAFHLDGHIVWLHEQAVPIFDEADTLLYWQGVMTDVTRRRQAEEEAQRRDSDMHAVLESISDPFYAVDRDMRVTYLNEAMTQRLQDMYGIPRGSAIGRPLVELLPNIRNSVTERRLLQTLDDGLVADFEIYLNAHRQWIAIRAFPSASGVAVYVRDVSAQRRLEARLTHQAFYDVLTGLPNQAVLRHRIELALKQAHVMRRRVAVMMVDVNRFRVINDSLGHAAGDELLLALGQRMAACVRADDLVARFGGDTFAIMLPAVDEIGDATEVAERLLQGMKTSFALSRRSVQTGVSIGIVVSDVGDDNPEDLLRRADLALHRAKNAGGSAYAVFGRDLHEAIMRRIDLEEALRIAVEQDAFDIRWQPIFDMRTGAVQHFEALTRWQDPQRGEVQPQEFIGLAEDTGIIVQLGRKMLMQACREAVAWGRQLTTTHPTICVNLSSREFREPDLITTIADTLAISGLPPAQLIIEITESLLMDDVDNSVERLLALKHLGIGIALDDFGTGYSSLAYLHRFPVDVLKLDQRFILDLSSAEQDRIIAGATINLAHALGMVTIGEGVETYDQLRHLRELGSDMAQGFYLSHPVSGESILRRFGTTPQRGVTT